MSHLLQYHRALLWAQALGIHLPSKEIADDPKALKRWIEAVRMARITGRPSDIARANTENFLRMQSWLMLAWLASGGLV
jgi:hypothetical protein